jgi:hypothetical protein
VRTEIKTKQDIYQAMAAQMRILETCVKLIDFLLWSMGIAAVLILISLFIM